MHILSFSGLGRSISNEALRECRCLYSRRYKNNRLGDFLKELELTEGRCTGIPTIQDELAKNGSPKASIETDEDRSYFLMYIPVHEGCGNVVTLKENEEDLHKDYPNITPILPHSYPIVAQSTLEMIMQNPRMTVKQLSKALGLSEKTIKIRLTLLKKEGIIVRVGNNRTGHWEVVGNVEE